MTKIELTTAIKAPIERCFDLARSVDLHKVSMQHSREESRWCCVWLNEPARYRYMACHPLRHPVYVAIGNYQIYATILFY